MECETCHKEIGNLEGPPEYRQVYQVRVGYLNDDGVTFIPDEDVGYYCSECLKEGA